MRIQPQCLRRGQVVNISSSMSELVRYEWLKPMSLLTFAEGREEQKASSIKLHVLAKKADKDADFTVDECPVMLHSQEAWRRRLPESTANAFPVQVIKSVQKDLVFLVSDARHYVRAYIAPGRATRDSQQGSNHELLGGVLYLTDYIFSTPQRCGDFRSNDVVCLLVLDFVFHSTTSSNVFGDPMPLLSDEEVKLALSKLSQAKLEANLFSRQKVSEQNPHAFMYNESKPLTLEDVRVDPVERTHLGQLPGWENTSALDEMPALVCTEGFRESSRDGTTSKTSKGSECSDTFTDSMNKGGETPILKDTGLENVSERMEKRFIGKEDPILPPKDDENVLSHETDSGQEVSQEIGPRQLLDGVHDASLRDKMDSARSAVATGIARDSEESPRTADTNTESVFASVFGSVRALFGNIACRSRDAEKDAKGSALEKETQNLRETPTKPQFYKIDSDLEDLAKSQESESDDDTPSGSEEMDSMETVVGRGNVSSTDGTGAPTLNLVASNDTFRGKMGTNTEHEGSKKRERRWDQESQYATDSECDENSKLATQVPQVARDTCSVFAMADVDKNAENWANGQVEESQSPCFRIETQLFRSKEHFNAKLHKARERKSGRGVMDNNTSTSIKADPASAGQRTRLNTGMPKKRCRKTRKSKLFVLNEDSDDEVMSYFKSVAAQKAIVVDPESWLT